MVFVIWIFFAIFIVLVIIFMNALCREKSLFIFRELDLTAITGGQRKRWIGGIITLFYFMVVIVVIFGFVFHWLFFNTRIETAEVKNLKKKERLPVSFILEATFYSSQIVEDHSKKTIYSEGEVDPYDLCGAQHITLVKSPFFD